MTKLFVPGRLCLFGEHTDWAGHYRTMNAEIVPGAAIVTGIEQGIYAEVEQSNIFEMQSTAESIAEHWHDFACRMDEQELKRIARSGDFFCYCAEVASYMLEWYKVGGVRITITDMTLPMKSGLSSSAAICVLVARAFNMLYNLNLNTMGEMNIAYLGELRTSSRCGRLDQACAFGVKPNLLIFDGDEIEVKSINVRKHLYWVFADLCGKKDTIKILSSLNKGYPFASNEMERREHEALGEKNQDIIERALKYMGEGNAEELGKLMTETEELFDRQIAPMCPEELASPLLKATLDDKHIKELTWGGKGVGSHGDGSVQFLAKSEAAQEELVNYLKSRGMPAYKLTIRPVHKVRKAIIPVAGFGTRLYPATRSVKKDFFPIVCPDGMVRPVILILLEELIKSGMEEICLVLGDENERAVYAEFFEHPLGNEHLRKLNKECQEYENHIVSIGKKLHYVYQKEKRGFGHAVYQAVSFAHGEPVLLMLGDTLYRSSTNKPCALQLIETYEKYDRLTVGLCPIELNAVSHFGMMAGIWEDEGCNILNVSMLVEKPSSNYAEEFLGVKTKRRTKDKNRMDESDIKEYCSVSGQYILTPEVFEQLENDIKEADQKGNDEKEIELTKALDAVRARTGMTAIRMKGKRYDMGNPNALVDTISNFSKPL